MTLREGLLQLLGKLGITSPSDQSKILHECLQSVPPLHPATPMGFVALFQSSSFIDEMKGVKLETAADGLKAPPQPQLRAERTSLPPADTRLRRSGLLDLISRPRADSTVAFSDGQVRSGGARVQPITLPSMGTASEGVAAMVTNDRSVDKGTLDREAIAAVADAVVLLDALYAGLDARGTGVVRLRDVVRLESSAGELGRGAAALVAGVVRQEAALDRRSTCAGDDDARQLHPALNRPDARHRPGGPDCEMGVVKGWKLLRRESSRQALYGLGHEVEALSSNRSQRGGDSSNQGSYQRSPVETRLWSRTDSLTNMTPARTNGAVAPRSRSASNSSANSIGLAGAASRLADRTEVSRLSFLAGMVRLLIFSDEEQAPTRPGADDFEGDRSSSLRDVLARDGDDVDGRGPEPSSPPVPKLSLTGDVDGALVAHAQGRAETVESLLTSATDLARLAHRIHLMCKHDGVSSKAPSDAATLVQLIEAARGSKFRPATVGEADLIAWCWEVLELRLEHGHGVGGGEEKAAGAAKPASWRRLEHALRDRADAIALRRRGEETKAHNSQAWPGLRGSLRRLHGQVLPRAHAEAALVGPASAAGPGGPWFVLHPSHEVVKALEAAFLWSMAYKALVLPTQLAFFTEARKLLVLWPVNYAVDGICVCRVAMHASIVSFRNNRQVTVRSPREIWRHFLVHHWHTDLVALLPLDLFARVMGAGEWEWSCLHLLRLLLASHVVAACRCADAPASSWTTLLRLLALLGATIHYMACGWNLLGFDHGAEIQDTRWPRQYYEASRRVEGEVPPFGEGAPSQLWHQYLIASYMATSMVTTLGMTIVPTNEGELLFYMGAMLVNLTVYAAVVGKISALVIKQDDEVVAKRSRLELVQGYVSVLRVGQDLKTRIQEYFRQRLDQAAGGYGGISAGAANELRAALPVNLQVRQGAPLPSGFVRGAAL